MSFVHAANKEDRPGCYRILFRIRRGKEFAAKIKTRTEKNDYTHTRIHTDETKEKVRRWSFSNSEYGTDKESSAM